MQPGGPALAVSQAPVRVAYRGRLSSLAMADQKIKNLERRLRKLEQQLEFVADRAGVGADLVELREAEEAAAKERTEETLAKVDALYGRRR
jgi:hypothetical protein